MIKQLIIGPTLFILALIVSFLWNSNAYALTPAEAIKNYGVKLLRHYPCIEQSTQQMKHCVEVSHRTGLLMFLIPENSPHSEIFRVVRVKKEGGIEDITVEQFELEYGNAI